MSPEDLPLRYMELTKAIYNDAPEDKKKAVADAITALTKAILNKN